MENLNLFGEADPVPFTQLPWEKKKRSNTKANGYAARPGTGPAGETCKTCFHRVENTNRTARTYWKCALMRHAWTGGTGSDVRAGGPACSRWEAKK